MKAIWAPEARSDRAEIFDYIEARNPDAAARLDDLFEKAAHMLLQSPYLGHPGEVAGTHE